MHNRRDRKLQYTASEHMGTCRSHHHTRHTAMNVVSVSQTGTIGCQPSSSLQSHSFASGRGELTQLEGEPEWALKYARTYPVECSCPTHETQHKSPGAVSHANVTTDSRSPEFMEVFTEAFEAHDLDSEPKSRMQRPRLRPIPPLPSSIPRPLATVRTYAL